MSKKAVVELLERIGVLAISRYIHRRSPLVLMYHRILKHDLVPGTYPETFAKQMDYVKKNFNVLNMSQLMASLQNGNVPDRALVLTFDDGHYDFYANAWPIIKSHGLTATLFVTTQFIDEKTWLWPDLLKYILMKAEPGQFKIDDLGLFDLDADCLLKTWNRLADLCLTMSAEDRQQFIENLADKLNIVIPQSPQLPFAPTTWSQLADMVAEGLDIGSHSLSHPILSRVAPDRLTSELKGSKARIEEMLNIEVTGICYPNGMPADISTNVQDEARKIYDYGVVAYPKKFNSNDLMRIGRIGATNDTANFRIKTSSLSRAENIGEYR